MNQTWWYPKQNQIRLVLLKAIIEHCDAWLWLYYRIFHEVLHLKVLDNTENKAVGKLRQYGQIWIKRQVRQIGILNVKVLGGALANLLYWQLPFKSLLRSGLWYKSMSKQVYMSSFHVQLILVTHSSSVLQSRCEHWISEDWTTAPGERHDQVPASLWSPRFHQSINT